MSYSGSESCIPLIDEIGAELLVAKNNVEKWKVQLTENIFDTCASLMHISSEDWMAMRIPLRVLVEARRRVDRTTFSSALPPRTTKPQPATPLPPATAPPTAAAPSMSGAAIPPPLRRNDRALSNLKPAVPVPLPPMSASAGASLPPPPLISVKQDSSHSISFTDLTQFIRKSSSPSLGHAKKPSTASLKKKKAKTRSVPKAIMSPCGSQIVKVNVVGREGHSLSLLRIAHGPKIEASASHEYQVFGEDVLVETFDATSADTVDPSVLVIVFSTHSLRSLTKMTDKWMQTVDAKPDFDLPIILVGLFKTEEKCGTREVSRFTALEVAEQMRAIRYVEVTSKADAHSVFMECGRVVVRDAHVDLAPRFADVMAKINRVREKKSTELGLRKRQIHMLPNALFQLAPFLQKLRLDNNNLTAFPVELLEFSHLMELGLPGNQIKELPPSIVKMKSLQRLDLESNLLDSLPLQELKKMNMLEELKLKGNPLSNLPEKINASSDILTQVKQLNANMIAPKDPSAISELPSYITPFKIFGVPLEDLMKNEYKLLPDNPIPRIVRRAFAHILTYGVGQEGIFRLAGQNVKMDAIREQIDNRCTVIFNKGENCHNVTNVLKQWLRTLPEPALLFGNFTRLLDMADLPVDECLVEFRKVLDELPKENYHLIRQTFRLMFLVANNSSVNRMDGGNVTKVVGPNLLYSKEVEMDPLKNISEVTKMNDVLERVTANYQSLFEDVPSLFDVDYLQEEPPTAILFRKMFGHKKSVIALQLTEDKSKLWTGDSAGILRVWDAETLILLQEVDLGKRINAMVRNGSYMWIGLEDSIEIRDQYDATELVDAIVDAPTYNLCVVDDSVWVGDAGKLIIYDGDCFMGEPVEIGALPVHLLAVGDHVWGACNDRKIRVWHKDTRAPIAEVDSLHDGGRINALSVINGKVWSAAGNGTLQVWDPVSFERIKLLNKRHDGKVFGVTRVGNQAWSYAWNGDVFAYDIEAPYEFKIKLPNFHSDAIGGVVALYSEKFQCWKAMTGSWDTSVCAWLVKAGPQL